MQYCTKNIYRILCKSIKGAELFHPINNNSKPMEVGCKIYILYKNNKP